MKSPVRPSLLLALLVAVTCLLPATSAAPAWAQASAPQAAEGLQAAGGNVAVISLSGYDALKADLGFIGRLSGNPEMANQLEAMLNLFTRNQGLAGLDKAKPWGAVVRFQDGQPMPLTFVPVTDLQQLLGVLSNFNIIPQERNGLHVIEQEGQTLFIKEQNGWAFVSNSEQGLAELPENPIEALNGLHEQYDFAVRLYIQNIPEQFRAMASAALQGGLQQGLREPLPGEEDAQFELRVKLAERQGQSVQQFLEQADHLTVGFAIDPELQKAYLDFNLTALPGTELAQQAAAQSDVQSDLNGFQLSEAAVAMHVASVAGEKEIQDVEPLIESARQRAMSAIDEESELPDQAAKDIVKSAVNDVLDVALATLKAGKIDFGATVKLEPNALGFVGGGVVADGPKLEGALKKLAKLAETEPNFPGVTWDAETHQGVRFHTMSLPVPEDEQDARQFLGDQLDVVIGISDSRFFVALGKESAALLKSVLDQSQAEGSKVVNPLTVTVSALKIAQFVAAQPDAEPAAAMVAQMLAASEGRDHLIIAGKAVPNGVSYRVEIEEGLLKAIAQAGTLVQGQAGPGGEVPPGQPGEQNPQF